MEEEIKSLRKNHTWMLINILRNHKVVGYKLMFRKKEGILGVKGVTFHNFHIIVNISHKIFIINIYINIHRFILVFQNIPLYRGFSRNIYIYSQDKIK